MDDKHVRNSSQLYLSSCSGTMVPHFKKADKKTESCHINYKMTDNSTDQILSQKQQIKFEHLKKL